ncbi:Tyrosine-protein kinase transmembrane receptor Ror [Halotydeus destructor]|nr:Tyrosine-protein kinase transmembrane receptor Ror [Halotydeus destructor]
MVAPGAGALGLFLLIISICCLRQRKKKHTKSGPPSIRSMASPTFSVGSHAGRNRPPSSGTNGSVELSSLLPRKQPRAIEYTMSSIRFIEELGEGAFGKVYRGELVMPQGAILPIAIKTLKEDATSKTKGDFQREADLMADLQHPNIVCLLGVCFREDPMSMLFEFMSEGDLHEYLQGHSPRTDIAPTMMNRKILDIQDFLHISTQIAAGMEYLSGHHYVHRDLAARNCLVGDHLTVKISDFGLSRDIYASDYYRVQSKSLLPVRWMPPESILYGKFTSESDVWSFGVVLWEVFSYGLQPYYGYNNQEVIDMIRSRHLLRCPEDCPPHIYSLMAETWHEIPSKRPSFTELHTRLRNWKAVYSNPSTMPSGSETSSLKSGFASSHRSSVPMPAPPPPSLNPYPSLGPPRPVPQVTHYSSGSIKAGPIHCPSPHLGSPGQNFGNMNHQHIQQHFQNATAMSGSQPFLLNQYHFLPQPNDHFSRPNTPGTPGGNQLSLQRNIMPGNGSFRPQINH